MDVAEFLKYAESHGLVRLNKIVGDYYSMYCPFHSDGRENRPSSGMLLHDQYRNGQLYPEGFFHCFTCGKALTPDKFLRELLKVHTVTEDVRNQLQEMVGEVVPKESGRIFSESFIKAAQDKFALNMIKSKIKPDIEYVSEEELAQYRYTVPYMYERKLTDDLIETFDVGVDMHYLPRGGKKEIPCITFPVRNEKGNTLFIVRRSIQGKRFFMPSDIQKPVYGLYELPKGCKSVVVVESCLNAITSTRYGRPAVALLGTGTSYQITQLKRLGVTEFIFGFDPDDAGDRATRKLSSDLRDVAICWRFEGIPAGKDINDLTEEEFKNLTLL